jgi:hypothetical protein
MAIIWGGISFEGPFPVLKWTPPVKPAIYVIMTMPDPERKPHMYQCLFFAESANLKEKEFWEHHEKYMCFIDEAKSTSNLYLGYHTVSGSLEHRKQLVLKLINRYNPICNK